MVGLSDLRKKGKPLKHLIKLYAQGKIKSRLDMYNQVFKFPITSTDMVFDAGCGVGIRSIEILSESNACVYAFDVLLHNVRTVKKEARTLSPDRFDAIQGDILHLPFRDGIFDKVLCLEVLEHVHNDEQALSELCRVLKVRGILMISVPTFFSEQFLNRLGLRHPYHLRTYTLEKILSMIAMHLDVTNIEKAYFQSFFLLSLAAFSHAPFNFKTSKVERNTLILDAYYTVWHLMKKLQLSEPLDFVLARFTPFARSVVITAIKEKD